MHLDVPLRHLQQLAVADAHLQRRSCVQRRSLHIQSLYIQILSDEIERAPVSETPLAPARELNRPVDIQVPGRARNLGIERDDTLQGGTLLAEQTRPGVEHTGLQHDPAIEIWTSRRGH